MTEEVWTVQRHLAGANPEVVALYHAFIEMVGGLGPFTYAVAKTSITLKGSRRGFAGATPKRDHLGGYLDLQRRIPETGVDPRIRNASPYTKKLFVHHFRITTLADLDPQFAAWLGEAYEVGNGAHVHRP
jgi:Domain of unknown function (DUF5655)